MLLFRYLFASIPFLCQSSGEPFSGTFHRLENYPAVSIKPQRFVQYLQQSALCLSCIRTSAIRHEMLDAIL